LKIKISVRASVVSLLLTSAFLLSAANAVAGTPNNQRLIEEARGLSAVQAGAQESGGTHFKGSIAGSRFEMFLRREGGDLRGSYYYLKSGSANRLSLRGKIGADGSFTMQESDSAGRQTGEFKGKWKDDPNESGASLEGEWKKPGGGEAQNFWASEQTVSFSDGTQVNDKHLNESIKARRLELTAEYPELTGGGANDAAFNQLVRTSVTRSLADFKKQMLSQSAEDLKMIPAAMSLYVEISYDVEYADNDLISIRFLEDTYEGGVHPNYNYFTVTYDLKQGRELKLSDLFKPGAKYLDAVSAYATRDLQSRKDPENNNESMGLAQDIFADGAKPTADNYARWNITKKGLMFTFDPYQVAAYAYGAQTVIIPYARLMEIARADGALTRITK
jgi:Protein of unknown function (DUF3298)/Deacetylase PdaC